MSREEVEELLKAAVVRINKMEAEYKGTIRRLEKRIEYLEEMVSSQKTMLTDSMNYINSFEDNSNGRKKEA